MQEILVIKSNIDRFGAWIEAFEDFEIEVLDWREIADPSAVDYALVWKPRPGWLTQFPNLKVIFSVGAGLDHLKGDNLLPGDIPVVRMVEQNLTAGMVEYVTYMVLRFHRFMPAYEQQQRNRHWLELLQVPAKDRTVSILGLGELGRKCGRHLADMGFNVVGWSRTPKEMDGVRCYSGAEKLEMVLAQANILVCLLPLTDQTRHILNADNFARMPMGSYLINAGRGGHQLDADIIEALDNGRLGGAALDVFETEPLPTESPVWTHPKITLTPHVASMTLPQTSAVHVYDNIQRFRNSQPLTHVADINRGY